MAENRRFQRLKIANYSITRCVEVYPGVDAFS